MFRISTNVLSINGQRNLFQTSKDLSTRMERLSSGLRINHAADDAAGLTASEAMRSQIAGQRTANDNMSRAITLLQTADSSLDARAARAARRWGLAVLVSGMVLATCGSLTPFNFQPHMCPVFICWG